jgi:hypothetical protein
MSSKLVALLMAACLFSGLAIGLSIGSLTYGSRLSTQNTTIVEMSAELVETRAIRDAWRKTATLVQKEMSACEDELRTRK